jgi:hypothetical protein
MGRSARWHDPAFQAELAAAELAGRRGQLGLGALAVATSTLSPAAGLGVGLRLVVRLVWLVGRLVVDVLDARREPARPC